MVASAPSSRHSAHFSSLEAAAMTRAPTAFAIWIAAVPTPPAAPRTSTVSPAFSSARSTSAWWLVPYVQMNAAASSKAKPGGSGSTRFASTHACVAKPPMPPNAATASPGLNRVTPSPTWSTTPAYSLPGTNASGGSNSLTLNRPRSVYTAANGVRYISGTPSDCVHVALTGLLEHRPDLVVSGINQGANMGDDTLYSGTVAAAMEGFLFGIPAIAFSQVQKGWQDLDAAARVARSVIEHVLRDPPASSHYLLNVNIPNRADADTRPRRITRLGRRHA